MDRRLLAALALALLAPALAGCTAQPRPAPVQPASAPVVEEPRLVNSTDAQNLSGSGDPGDFQKSLDEKFHTHNYWGGALEKKLFDADVPASPLVPGADPGSVASYLFRSLGFTRGTVAVGVTPFNLTDGQIVPPEANKLTVTITWASSPTITGLSLAFHNASSDQVQRLPPLPEGGGVYDIASTVSANDIPHTTESKWRFFLVPSAATGPAVFNGTAHVTVKAFRNDTLYVAPPHKDFWQANTTLHLFDYRTAAKQTWAALPVEPIVAGATGSDQGDGFGRVPVPNGTLVPPHTGSLTMVLTWKNNSTLPNIEDLHPVLGYAPADSRRPVFPQGTRQGDRLTYVVPVDAKMVDSPYSERTQWQFYVFLSSSTSDANPLGFPVNAGQFDGTYALNVTAEREALTG